MKRHSTLNSALMVSCTLAVLSPAWARIRVIPDPNCDVDGVPFQDVVRHDVDQIKSSGDCTHKRAEGPLLDCQAPSASIREIAMCLDMDPDREVAIRCEKKRPPNTYAFDQIAGQFYSPDGQNLAAYNNARDGIPTDALIDFNPTIHQQFPSEACYAEPQPTLAHELVHAWLLANGRVQNARWLQSNSPNEYPPDEGGSGGVLAKENAFRISGCSPCQRNWYLQAFVPGVFQTCLMWCCECFRGNYSPPMCAVDANDYCFLYVETLADDCSCPNSPPQCHPALILGSESCGCPAC
jgi:hypothetical protein